VARVFDPYGGYRRALGATLEPVVETDGLLAIGVNTTRPGRHKNGQVSPAQVARVAQRLRQAGDDRLRVLLLHHPVRAAVESDRANLLIGADVAVPAWVDAGADLDRKSTRLNSSQVKSSYAVFCLKKKNIIIE